MYKKILLAFDGSRSGHAALTQGADLARLCGARVVLVAVVALESGAVTAETLTAATLTGLQVEETEQILEEGTQELRHSGLAVEACLRQGHPASEIGQVAREVGADLIVVGHRDQDTLSRWWRGSTGASLLAHLPCSLLVVIGAQATQGESGSTGR